MPAAFLPTPPRLPLFVAPLSSTRLSPLRARHLTATHRRPYSTAPTMSSSAAPPMGDNRILFAKAGPNGELGDCPFTHKANLALRFRKAQFDVYNIDLSNKPDWFLELNDAGTAPVFVDHSQAYGDSDDIVEHADRLGSGPKLACKHHPRFRAASDAIAPIFSAFVSLIKNKHDSEEHNVRKALDDVLIALDDFLADSPGLYLLGDQVTALDCGLAPKLHHIQVAGSHYKKYSVPEKCTRLISYIDNMRSTDAWGSTACADDIILWGWGKFFA